MQINQKTLLVEVDNALIEEEEVLETEGETEESCCEVETKAGRARGHCPSAHRYA